MGGRGSCLATPQGQGRAGDGAQRRAAECDGAGGCHATTPPRGRGHGGAEEGDETGGGMAGAGARARGVPLDWMWGGGVDGSWWVVWVTGVEVSVGCG